MTRWTSLFQIALAEIRLTGIRGSWEIESCEVHMEHRGPQTEKGSLTKETTAGGNSVLDFIL